MALKAFHSVLEACCDVLKVIDYMLKVCHNGVQAFHSVLEACCNVLKVIDYALKAYRG